MKNILLLAFGILVSATAAKAQRYSYDSTFATGGKNYWAAHNGNIDYFYASTPDASGGAYFSGWTTEDGKQYSVLAHLDQQGSLLPNGDLHKIEFDGLAPQGVAIDMQADGKPIVLNSLADSDKNTLGVGVYRSLASGDLDMSFGSEGKFQLFLPDYDFSPSDVFLSPIGEIFIIGGIQQIAIRANHWSMMLKLKPNGTIDSTFGIDGLLKFNRGNYLTYLDLLVPTPDGRMVVACTEKSKQFWEISANGEEKEIEELNGENGSLRLLNFFDYTYAEDKLYLATADAGTRALCVVQLSANFVDSIYGIDTIYESAISFSVQDASFLADGNIVYAGFVSGIPKVVMLDLMGKEVVDFTTGGAVYEPTQKQFNVPYTVSQTTRGDLLIGGQTIRGVADSTGQDFYALRMENLRTLSVAPLEKPDIRVYPVPCTNVLTITTVQPIERVLITDQLGKVYLDMSSTATQLQLDVANLSNGLYFIKIVQGEQTEIRRILKE